MPTAGERKMISEENIQRGLKLLKDMGRENTLFEQEDTSDDMYRLSVGYLFGEIWSRPNLSLRERQIVTLAANIAMARPSGTHSHYRSAKKVGLTHEEICEIMIQVGAYAGWPTMAHANRQYRQVLAEDKAAATKARKKPKTKKKKS
jgi:4-carboxymuconolactone decarboxylase